MIDAYRVCGMVLPFLYQFFTGFCQAQSRRARRAALPLLSTIVLAARVICERHQTALFGTKRHRKMNFCGKYFTISLPFLYHSLPIPQMARTECGPHLHLWVQFKR